MKTITDVEFEKEISKKNLVVIDFSATWCMPCRMLKPIMERVEKKMEDVEFFNVDIDDSEEIAKRYRIFSVPTLVAFREGKKVDSMVGLNAMDDIVDFVERCKTADVNED